MAFKFFDLFDGKKLSKEDYRTIKQFYKEHDEVWLVVTVTKDLSGFYDETEITLWNSKTSAEFDAFDDAVYDKIIRRNENSMLGTWSVRSDNEFIVCSLIRRLK